MRFLLILIVFLISSHSLTGQESDSLSLTRYHLRKGEFRQADQIIKNYYLHHPDDFNTVWLYAYTSYFARHFGQSDRLYRKAVSMSDKNYYLKLDYARMLVNIGDNNRAKPILDEYITFDPKNGTALFTLSRLQFNQADYRKAFTTLDRIPKDADEYQYVQGMKRKIALWKAPWISFGTGYNWDDQPLVSWSPALQAGWSLHPLANLGLNLRTPVFIKNDVAYTGFWGDIRNKFHIASAAMDIEIGAGGVIFPKKNNADWTASFSLSKIFARNLEIRIDADRSPYFFTASSIDSSVIDNHGALTLAWNDQNSWTGAVVAELHQYPIDNNTIGSVNAWLMAPPIRFSVFDVRLGAGYGYSSSQKNNFVAEKSLDEIVSTYSRAAGVKGIYNPYFTPDQQSVASVILSASIRPTATLDINLYVNAGLYSFAQVPYLYLDKDSSSNIFIRKGFVRQNYIPANGKITLGWNAADNIRFEASYTISSTYYYLCQGAALTCKLNLVNGRKK
jgi:hypothetical protein